MEAQLFMAAQTLARLPSDAMTRPGRERSAWPEMIRRTGFLYGGTRRNSRPLPTPQQIDAMNATVQLLWYLDDTGRQLVWARACRVPWAELVARMGRSRTSLYRDYHAALGILARHKD